MERAGSLAKIPLKRAEKNRNPVGVETTEGCQHRPDSLGKLAQRNFELRRDKPDNATDHGRPSFHFPGPAVVKTNGNNESVAVLRRRAWHGPRRTHSATSQLHKSKLQKVGTQVFPLHSREPAYPLLVAMSTPLLSATFFDQSIQGIDHGPRPPGPRPRPGPHCGSLMPRSLARFCMAAK